MAWKADVMSGVEPKLAKKERPKNKLGQELGVKGDRTRRQIMDAVAELLESQYFGSIRITDISRASGIGQSNFYVYFDDVEEVLLALAQEAAAVSEDLPDLVEGDWRGMKGVERARRLVERSIEIWEKYRPILNVVTILSDALHEDFLTARAARLHNLQVALEREIRKAGETGRLNPSIDPRVSSFEVITLIDGVGARYRSHLASGVSHKDLVETTARLLHLLMTGRSYFEPEC